MNKNGVFKLYDTGASSERYGNCECCNKPVSAVYRLVGMQEYTRRDGSKGFSMHHGIDQFGHKECLEKTIANVEANHKSVQAA